MLLFVNPLSAQQNLPSINYAPQSPEAAALYRYQEIPVDLSTGVPNVQIPIHTIILGDTEIPILISYHASGIKVSDVASEVGLGWVLNIGGNVTCQIMDHPDFNNYQYPSYRTTADAMSLIQSGSNPANGILGYEVGRKFWYDITQRGASEPGLYDGTADFFSDRFSFSLSTGESGVFRKDFVNGDIHFLPYMPVKVSSLQGDVIQLKSANGSTHTFKAANGLWDLYLPSEIISTKNQKAQYHYSKTYYSTSQGIATSLKWYDSTYQLNSVGLELEIANGGYDLSNTPVYQNTITKLPDSITTDNVVISFDYVKDRLDAANYRLRQVIVKDKISREELKRFVFKHSYFVGNGVGNSHRLRLDKIVSYSNTSRDSMLHRFEYNDIPLPPYPSQANGYTMYNDYWGYSGTSKQYQIPDLLLNFNIKGKHLLATQLGNFNPKAVGVKSALLEKIHYPTGGRTEFTFNANCDSGLIGGVRVSEIRTYDGISPTPIVKTYKYHNPVYEAIDFTDFVGSPETTNHAYYKIGLRSSHLAYPTYSASSSNFSSKTNPDGTLVVFGTVEEFIGDGTNNIGKNVYNYDNFDLRLYNYANPASIDYEPGNKASFLCDYGSYKPKLYSMLTYSNVSTEGFKLVRKELNSYTTMKSKQFPAGLAVASKINIINAYGHNSLQEVYDMHSGSGTHLRDHFSSSLIFCDAIAHEDHTVLTEKTIVDYLPGEQSEVTTVETYRYDDYLQIAERTKSAGNNSVKKTQFKYPYDPDFVSQQPYSKMVNLNKIAPVVEETELKDAEFLKTTRTIYKNWLNDIIEPELIKNKMPGDLDLSTRVQFYGYDANGNIESVSKERGASTSYIWGYKKSVPVIKADNLNLEQIRAACNQALSQIGYSSGIESDLDTFLKSLGDLSSANSKSTWRTFNARLRENVPGGSFVSTYTHKPLIGVTSETDIKGRTTYYDYDGFGRLQRIRDHEDQVIKQFCYNYAGQAIDCAPATAVTIYARIELQNFQTTTDNVDGYTQTVTYADEYIRFYSDAACTQPYTLTSSLSVSHTTSSTYSSNGGSSTSSHTSAITVPAGSSSYYCGNNETSYYEEYGWDPYWGYLYDMYNYGYQITPGAGYQPITTIIR